MNQQARESVAVDLVVPCYNEEEALPETHRQLSALTSALRQSGQISVHSKIYYVDDGSRDRTWALIAALSEADDTVVGIRLSRNYGHQSALIAGLFSATGDAVITVDADLQDDISVIPEMIERRWYFHPLHNQRAAALKTLLYFKGSHRIIVINLPWHVQAGWERVEGGH